MPAARMLKLAVPFALLLSFFFPCSSYAELTPLENTELEQICGNGGFSMAIKNVQIFEYIDKFRYSASDNGYLELDNIKVNDGSGGAFHLNYDFGTQVTRSGAIYFDVGEPQVASEFGFGTAVTSISRGMISIQAPVWDQDITYTVSNFIIDDPNTLGAVDLGELELGPIKMPSFAYFYSPPVNEQSGLAWENDFQLIIDHATFLYKIDNITPSNGEKITLSKLYMGNNFTTGSSDNDPRFPSHWAPNNGGDIGQFKIGDLFGDVATNTPSNPARFDVTEGDFRNTGTIYGGVILNTPLIGSIRFEDVQFGATDFGPGAIDGIHAYRMTTLLIP